MYLLHLFADSRNPHRRLFILRSRYQKRRNNKTSCSSHDSDTAVAGSEFRSPESNPSYLTPIVVSLDGTTRYVLGCVTITRLFAKNHLNLHILRGLKCSLYLQNRKWTGLEKVKVGELGRFSPPPSDVATLYSGWRVFLERVRGRLWMWLLPLVWNSGTGEDSGLLEA